MLIASELNADAIGQGANSFNILSVRRVLSHAYFSLLSALLEGHTRRTLQLVPELLGTLLSSLYYALEHHETETTRIEI